MSAAGIWTLVVAYRADAEPVGTATWLPKVRVGSGKSEGLARKVGQLQAPQLQSHVGAVGQPTLHAELCDSSKRTCIVDSQVGVAIGCATAPVANNKGPKPACDPEDKA